MKVLGILLLGVIASASAFEKPVFWKDVPVGKANIEGRITMGYPAHEGKVPYIVGLGFSRNGGGTWCGGSIIGNTWVMTAKHCTDGMESVTIYYGALWRLQAQYTHWVGRNDFIEHGSGDISLIRTPHVDFWSLVNKVELPRYDDRYNNYQGWWALVSGWGKTSDDVGVSEYLNCVDVQIGPNSVCESYYGNFSGDLICIPTPENKGTCNGDSGGPLVLHDGNRQVGIVSFGSSAGCLSNGPKGMVRVTSYLDWIRDHTGISY
ncbi:serine protease 1 [Drosophila guanche]|uniref:trypsin n=1 Tax=Drosophila guanche TaxID=7266 RepID=A0A3B0JVK4_DROGU|nr:serine protease 1 [Drosophila guanche]SPP85093.1 blast:Serine proteases 1/2 [Drosophila guanche]